MAGPLGLSIIDMRLPPFVKGLSFATRLFNDQVSALVLVKEDSSQQAVRRGQ
jgi:hypothetical protein